MEHLQMSVGRIELRGKKTLRKRREGIVDNVSLRGGRRQGNPDIAEEIHVG